MTGTARRESLRETLQGRLESLPPFPSAALRLIESVLDEDVEVHELAVLLERDPALVVEVLRHANSARYSLVEQVETLDQAVMVLGRRGISDIALTALVDRHLIQEVPLPGIATQIWRHSLVCSSLARELASHHRADVSLATTVGILQQIGRLALMRVVPRHVELVATDVLAGSPVLEAETRHFGASGEVFCALAAQRLGLPLGLRRHLEACARPLTEAAEGPGEETEHAPEPVVRTVRSAAALASLLGYPAYTGAPGPPPESAIERLMDVGPGLARRLATIAKRAVEVVGDDGELRELSVQDASASPDRAFDALLRANRRLARLNADFESARREVDRRLDEKRRLAETFAAMTMGLDEHALRYSLLEALLENYEVDLSFLVSTRDGSGRFKGLAFKLERDRPPEFHEIELGFDRLHRSTREPLTRGEEMLLRRGKGPEVALFEVPGEPEWVRVAPLLVRGRCHGLLGVGQIDPRGRGVAAGSFLNIIAGAAALGLDNARLYGELLAEATIDPLTSVWTRRVILERLDEAVSTDRRPLGVLLVDLDHFKSVNDVLGHQAGDRYLRDVARRMMGCLGPHDLLGRYGGDEFLVVCRGREAQQLQALAEQLRVAVLTVAADERWTEVEAQLGATIGQCLWTTGKVDGSTLIALADSSLYAAKVSGRNQVGQVALPEMHGA